MAVGGGRSLVRGGLVRSRGWLFAVRRRTPGPTTTNQHHDARRPPPLPTEHAPSLCSL